MADLIMVDVIPELGAIYRKDSGCRQSPHCLDCPLPECVHDNPPEPESHWYALRKAQGKCASCPEQAIAGESRCPSHKASNAARQRNRRAKLREIAHAK